MSEEINDLIEAMREHADEAILHATVPRQFGKGEAMAEARRFYDMADWIENVYLKELTGD